VPKGASWLTTKLLSFGMWSAGSGPPAASVLRLSAVSTARTSALPNEDGKGDLSERTVEHDDLVRRVNVERVIERERARVVREGRVCARVVPVYPSAPHPSLNIQSHGAHLAMGVCVKRATSS
jgi:hypothetical protein